jgi:phage shock protein PspC (stress-responsive transcriptional regulator)
MNRVVNINLNGLVFSIDDMAYEQLKSYLDGLKAHFAGTEGAAEIISDIEARIAELLQAKLSDRHTVVQVEDVADVIRLMGGPREIGGEDEPAVEEPNEKQYQHHHQGAKKLRRDPNHKTLGGVCAGLANYFGVDMIIPRVLFLIALFGFGSGLLLYIILWIVIPEATVAEAAEDAPAGVKRLFRDPDNKSIGGVCSGISKYLGIDAVWLKLAFLIALFVFGTGVLVYIVLWLAIPEAKTSAEKLQMKGEAVDVSNIEKVVRDTIGKSGEHVKKGAHAASEGMNKASGALSEILNAIFRLAGKLIGAGLLIISVIVIGGLIFVWNYSLGDLTQKLDVAGFYHYFQYGFALFAFSIAALILLAGIKLMFHARLKVKLVSMILTVTLIIGVALMLTFGIQYKQSVSEKDVNRETVALAICPDTLYIRTNPQPDEDEMEEVSINVSKRSRSNTFRIGYIGDLVKVLYNTRVFVKPTKSDSLQLVLIKTARGESERAAANNARAIRFNASLSGNVLTIDRGILLDSSPFKFQQVVARLKIPVGTVVKVDKYAMKMINKEYEEDFDLGETFRMTSKGLRCIDCMDIEDYAEDSDFEWNVEEDESDIRINIKTGKSDAESNFSDTIRAARDENRGISHP